MINYINDNGQMEVPPRWWLKALLRFDDQLRVIPSRQRPGAYILARVPRFSRGLNPVVEFMKKGGEKIPADTQLCANYNVVPVTLILKQGGEWTIDNILADLKSRDLWTQGGADKVADELDKRDREEEAKAKSSVFQDLYHRGRDAWRSYTARTGSRVNPGGTAAQAARRDTSGGAIKQPETAGTQGSAGSRTPTVTG